MDRFPRGIVAALALALALTLIPVVPGASPAEAFASAPPSDVTYNSVSFVDRSNGWIAGSNGTIIRTRNGGNNWQVLDVGTTDEFVSISFADLNKGWALTRAGRTWRTADGGDAWVLMPPAKYNGTDLVAGAFYDPEAHAIEVAGTNRVFFSVNKFPYASGQGEGNVGILYRSAVGGESWELTHVLEQPDYRHPDDWTPVGESQFRGIEFIDQNTGWVVGIDYYAAKTSPFRPAPFVYKTTTGGGKDTWVRQTLPTATGFESLNGVSFVTSSFGIAVGDNGNSVRTTNGGTTWTLYSTGTTSRLNDVFVLDANNAWAVGESGTIRRTINGGLNWTAGWAQSASVSLRSVQLVDDPLLGWLAGASGRVRLTTDGQNWYPPVPEPLVHRVPADYPTIGEAIAASTAGDTVEVSTGTYVENLVVDKSLTLRSASGAQVLINAADSAFPVLSVRANGVIVDGGTTGQGISLVGPSFAGVYCDGYADLQLRGVGAAGSTYGAYLTDAPGALVDGCDLSSNAAVGLALYHASHGATVRDSVFADNDYGVYALFADAHDVSDSVFENRFYGVFLDQSEGNTFAGVDFSDNAYAGLAAYFNSDDNAVTGSTFVGNGFGIYAYSSSGNAVSASTVGPNDYYGAFFEAAPQNLVGSSVVTGNPYAGVAAYYSSHGTVVTDCDITGNGFGVYVALSNTPAVSGSTISDNLFYGMFLESSTGANVAGNAIERNPYAGLVLQASDSASVTGNMIGGNGWGSYAAGSASSVWWGNNFIANLAHAFDDSAANAYDDGVNTGNHWDTWTAPDADMDGIVDLPYEVPGGACVDQFPRVDPLL